MLYIEKTMGFQTTKRRERRARSPLTRWAYWTYWTGVVLVSCLVSCSSKPGAGKNERLNLLIALVDTTRSDHIGYSGYPRRTTPHIDAFGKEAVIFENHHSHSSRTGPSVASIFTGLHPKSHGVINPLTRWDAKGKLAEDQTTLAEILKKNGYDCFGFVANLNVSGRFGFGQGFDSYKYLESIEAADLGRGVLERLAARPDRPFFLYLHYMEPHSPYNAPEPYRRKFVEAGYKGPFTGAHRQLGRIVRGKLRPNSEDIAHLIGLYDQEILQFDDAFQDLLDALKKEGLLDRTVVVFTADHGEEFYDHGSVLHGYTLYEEQLKVPFAIRDPRIKGPARVVAVTRHVDVLPTVLELLGIPSETPVQGTSLVPWMKGERTDSATGPVHAQSSLKAVKTVKGVSFTVDGWKLISSELPQKTEELYDLEADPGEKTNLIAREADKAAALRQQLRAFEKTLEEAESDMVDLTEEEIDQLRSLGYLPNE